jgi:His-Xaa-Ser system radical SAM maturase HxsC
MLLQAKVDFGFNSEPFLAKVGKVTDADVRVLTPVSTAGGRPLCLSFNEKSVAMPNSVFIGRQFSYLAEGDIVRIDSNAGEMRVVFRTNSIHNVIFMTERCNCRCIMCVQPPQNVDDSWRNRENLELIAALPKDLKTICVTGGEPTLNKEALLNVVKALAEHLPDTDVHILSNARTFNDVPFAKAYSDATNNRFTIGVPLHGVEPQAHDFIAQSHGAFHQTINGLLNLAANKSQVEIRVVIHRYTAEHLADLAEFVVKNLPFVVHVAFMGMEPVGYAKSNFENLHVPESEWWGGAARACKLLDAVGIPVSIYNVPLCLLREDLRPYARQSISDWKDVYLPVCETCKAKTNCCGLFESARELHSLQLQPIQTTEVHPVLYKS